jgi:peptidyl-prolyl cis-trans isomerase SurA
LLIKYLVFLCLLAVPALAAQENRIAAVVNDDIITDADVLAQIKLVELSSNIPDTPENQKRLGPQVMRNLVDQKLELQEAKRLGIAVTQADIDKAVANIERRNNMKEGGLEALLQDRGISHDAFINQIKASIAFQKVVQARVSQDVQVSDDEVDEAMKRMQADIGKPQSRVAEIFLAVDNPSQEEEIRQVAERLIEQIRGGANFGAVAQQFSQSPSAAVGGDIGWVTSNELSPRLADAIDKMSPGQMSYPIRTPAGFYLLYLLERRVLGAETPDQVTLSLDEVIFPLATTAAPEEKQAAEAQAQRVSAEAKSCGEMAKIGAERAPQLSRQIPQIRASELPAEMRQPILALKVAEASKPMPLPGGVGVVMVCARQGAPTLPTRDELMDTMARERLDALARRYLRDLHRDAYVDLRQ